MALIKRRELKSRWEVQDCVQPEGMPEYTAGNIRGAADTLAYLSPWANEDQEVAVILFFNSRMKLIGHKEIGRGTMHSCPMDIPSIFRAALLAGAAAIILSHNHPSGDVSPSEADIVTTHEVRKAGELLGITVLDHIITGMLNNGKIDFYSMREKGVFCRD